jgi:quercetin dioxygenase-like cupin family protein
MNVPAFSAAAVSVTDADRVRMGTQQLPDRLVHSPLEGFARWYRATLFGKLSLVQHDGISVVLPGMGLTLYRQPPFQVQLFLFRPNEVIKEHAHPNVDSYEVYLCGQMQLTLDGKPAYDLEQVKALPDGRCSVNGSMLRIPPGAVHGGTIGPTGGAFISIQYWLNGNPGPIHEDWIGNDGSSKG